MRTIDAHVHFFDTSRSQGVPWPSVNDEHLYRPTFPDDYRTRVVPQEVVGAVAVEASAWTEDNQWVLNLAAKDPFIVGLVGNLPAGTRAFAAHLTRFAANPRFLGIRVKQERLSVGIEQPTFVADLRLLAAHDLALDIFGGPALLRDVARLAALIPELRVVINHVGNLTTRGRLHVDEWQDDFCKAAAHPQIFCKVSGLVEGTGRRDGTAPGCLGTYRWVLDQAWNAFGEDRLIYGSNWPVSECYAPLATVQQIVVEYFAARGGRAAEKTLFSNAVSAYKLHKGWLA